MNGQQPHARPAAAILEAGGVYVPSEMAEPLWRLMREEINRRAHDGGRVRPEFARLAEVLRAAALAHQTAPSAHGPQQRTAADIAPHSPVRRLISTAELAHRLRVTERHVRRLASQEGIEPVVRNAWDPETVTALRARRGA